MATAKAFSSITARLEPALAQRILDEAEKRGVSNRVVIADALKEHFDNETRNGKPRELKTGDARTPEDNAADGQSAEQT